MPTRALSSLTGLGSGLLNSSLKQPAQLGFTPRLKKAGSHRVHSALSEETVLVHIETHGDGSTTYHFGAEGELPPQATSLAHTEIPLEHTPVPQNNGHANGAPQVEVNGVKEVSPATINTVEAAEKLEELLHLDAPAPVAARSRASATLTPSTSTNNGNNGVPRQQPQQQRRSNNNGTSKKHSSPSNPATLEIDVATVDYQSADSYALVGAYSALCDSGRLDDALTCLKGCIKGNRNDVLIKLKHYKFLRPASRLHQVSKALRFVQLLPRQFVDARTYNMLLSVCAEAGDLRNALHSVDMLKASGLRMDTILYTNLLKVCAASAKAEEAFRVYDEMKTNRIRMEKEVYATLVSACSARIERLPLSDRRSQLVLLERAFALIDDMNAAKVMPDAAVWNALVTASGRAGQLQRAFDVLENMMATSSSKPNARTYASLIDACARTGDQDLALRVYKRALKDGAGAELPIYSAAINSCVRGKKGADLQTAMSVFTDLQRNGVVPDSALYGALIMAAGKAGDLNLTISLEQDMQEDGIPPCEGTDSALITVHILNDRLDDATNLYQKMKSKGRKAHHHAMNALINANARACKLGDVVNLVSDMVASGLKPDAFTFAAVLNACQRADESELALDVYRLMKMRKIPSGEVHAMLLLRMCYNRIRQGWTGTAPTAGASWSSHRSQERTRLLDALTPVAKKGQVLFNAGDTVWHVQAFAIYKDAVQDGLKPSLRVLNMACMCLRLPWVGQKKKQAAEDALNGISASGVRSPPPSLAASISPAEASKVGIEGVYHVQVISIIEDAIVSGVVPAFTVDSTGPIDLRALPPAVAEVYTITVVAALQRKVDARREIINRLVLLVPRYDGGKVLMPSTAIAEQDSGVSQQHHAEQEHASSNGRGLYGAAAAVARGELSDSELIGFADSDEAYNDASSKRIIGDEKTGLGVAGVLRRLQLWAREYSPEGLIVLEAKELNRWCKYTSREIEKRTASAFGSFDSLKRGAGALLQQRRDLRTY